MGRLQDTFAALKAAKRKAYIGYAMAGFPSRGSDLKLARAVLKEADILELGLPFSDPIADGPVIQRCGELALQSGGGLKRALELAKALRRGSDKPLLLMSYLNPVLALGAGAFAGQAKAAGIDGLVIPDLPPEEGAALGKTFKAAGLDLVYLAAPTSTAQRMKSIAKAATGFIYVVSVAGVTGERKAFDARLGTTLKALRRRTDLPLAVGFGISSPSSARNAARISDGVVVASTVLKEVLSAPNTAAGLKAAARRTAALAKAVHSR